MESPHDDEFDKNNMFIGPANGKTGDNISDNLSEFINVIHAKTPIKNGNYDLILMNAVSFQCSMGFSTNYFRDLTFVSLWFDGGKRCFINRLNNYSLTVNDIIISSCTLGSHKYFKQTFGIGSFNEKALRNLFKNDDIEYSNKIGLRGLVDDALECANIKARIIKAIHPCRWESNNLLRN